MSPEVASHPGFPLLLIGTASNRAVEEAVWAMQVEVVPVSKLHLADGACEGLCVHPVNMK